MQQTLSYIIRNVIQFNNNQNKIAVSDFRSTDRIQKKLKEQVAKIPDAEYEGGRRGGHSDVIKRSKRLLPSYTVGQTLAAFHGDPEKLIRTAAIHRKVPIMTTMAGAWAAAHGIDALRRSGACVKSLQEYHLEKRTGSKSSS